MCSSRPRTTTPRHANGGGPFPMRPLAVLVLTGVSLAVCSSPQQTAGTAAGVAAGAVVAGPIGGRRRRRDRGAGDGAGPTRLLLPDGLLRPRDLQPLRPA